MPDALEFELNAIYCAPVLICAYMWRSTINDKGVKFTLQGAVLTDKIVDLQTRPATVAKRIRQALADPNRVGWPVDWQGHNPGDVPYHVIIRCLSSAMVEGQPEMEADGIYCNVVCDYSGMSLRISVLVRSAERQDCIDVLHVELLEEL